MLAYSCTIRIIGQRFRDEVKDGHVIEADELSHHCKTVFVILELHICSTGVYLDVCVHGSSGSQPSFERVPSL